VKDLFEDPHLKARENIVAVPNPLGGLLHMVGVVPRLSLTPGRIRSVGPLSVGENNDEIYRGRLGLSAEEFAALQQKGVI
ncbi:MAG: CoA transferase, partial [candidate division NC10 bacterium]